MATDFSPRAGITGLSLRSCTAKGAQVDVHLQIENPHSLAIDLVDIDFLIEDEDADKKILVKKVEHPYAIQPCSSEVMKVPLNFEYKDIVTTTNKSASGHAGQMIPCTVRANLNFRQTISGMFKVSVEKVKHMLTVGENTGDAGFRAPTGYVNGMDIVSVSPKQVDFSLVMRVRNSNALPVELAYTEFTMECEGKRVLEKRVDSNVTIRGNSWERVSIPLVVTFEELSDAGLELKPGELLPFKLKMDFWFKETFHGTYKISQERSGSIPVFLAPRLKLEAVVFEHNSEGKPIAKMQLHFHNENSIAFKLMKLEYIIGLADGGAHVAKASYHDSTGMEIENNKLVVFELEVEELDPAFGSALWDMFSGDENVYKPVLNMEGVSTEYGKIMT